MSREAEAAVERAAACLLSAAASVCAGSIPTDFGFVVQSGAMFALRDALAAHHRASERLTESLAAEALAEAEALSDD